MAAYKSLSQVERAFRSMKMTRLHVRPVFVYTEQHVLGHVFLCLLAWYLEWHLRRRLAPLLFEDEAPPVRDSPVQKAEPSQPAKAKAATKRTPDGDPVHSVTTLLNDLATVTLNEVTLPGHPDSAFPLVTKSTPLQAKALLSIPQVDFGRPRIDRCTPLPPLGLGGQDDSRTGFRIGPRVMVPQWDIG